MASGMFGSRKREGRRRGFLLIELLAATVILSTALLVLSRAFSNSARLLQRASSQLRAATLLEEKLSEYEMKQTLSAGSEEGTFPLSGSYRWSAEIRKRPEPSLYQVAVTVSWQEVRRPQSVTVTALLEKSSETP